jgi:maltooligosyltrehalose trehalohydrolase
LHVEFDENQRWIVMRRGALAIACNVGEDATSVPVTGELVLAWGEPQPGPEETTLAGHSFAILRTVKPVSTTAEPVDNALPG